MPSAHARPAPRPIPVLDRADAGLAGGPQAALRTGWTPRWLSATLRRPPSLDDTDKWRATRLLARPSDRAGDPYGDGYRALHPHCRGPICVHFVRDHPGRPPDADWARPPCG